MSNGNASAFMKVTTPPEYGMVTRRLVVGVISFMAACGGAACDRTSSASASSGDPIATNSSPIAASEDTRDSAPQENTPKRTANYALSQKAREIEKMLDRGATAGAERLLNVYLNSDPGDAGMLAQYARYVIMTQPPSGVSWMTSPLDTSDRFRPLYIVANAASTASDLDPDIRPYLAEALLSAYEQTSRAALDRGEGVISDPVLFMTPFEASLANIGWWSMKFDAARAERWSKPFEALAAQAARNGKVASAMMLGNLAGDLKQRGEGDHDFRLANKYFLESLKNVGTAPDQNTLSWLRVTLNAYSTLFADELAAIEQGHLSDPNYTEVLVLAKRVGARDNANDDETPKRITKYDLSARARELEILLDRGDTSGAERLFGVYLNTDTGDAGILAQYARFIIMTQPVHGDSTRRWPLNARYDDWTVDVVANVSALAIDRDSDIRSYIAELLLTEYQKAAHAALDRGQGVISSDSFGKNPIQISLAKVGWISMEIDAALAQRWSKSFETLAAMASQNGKVASAMMLGALAGDLAQSGVGDKDFRFASKYFLESMKHFHEDPDRAKCNWIQLTWSDYSRRFAEEIGANQLGQTSDPTFAEVERMAKQMGAR